MLIRSDELTGHALDWAVAKSVAFVEDVGECGLYAYVTYGPEKFHLGYWRPSQKWEQCGPLIEHYDVTVIKDENVYIAGFDAHAGDGPSIYMEHECSADQYLVSACRAIVKKELGARVDVPDELLAAAHS